MSDDVDEAAVKEEITRLEGGRYTFSGSRSTLGVGGFAMVLLAQDRMTGDTVAIKRINPSVLQSAGRRILNELMLFSQLQHDNIVRMLNCFTNANASGTYDTVYMVFEYLQNDLKSVIYHRPPILESNHISWITYQILLALRCMHAQHVVHRDVTPSNVLVNPKGTEVKLCDLGLSRVAADRATMTSYVTQRWYRAPEVVAAMGHGLEVDMWSVGCVLAEMLRRAPLFRLQPSRTAPSDELQRMLRAQQLGRILAVTGPPSEEEIRGIESANVRNWLTQYRNRASARYQHCVTAARSIISTGAVGSRAVPIPDVPAPAQADAGILEVQSLLSGASPSAEDSVVRIARAVGLLRSLFAAFPSDPRLLPHDVLAHIPALCGARPALRYELPAEVDAEAYDICSQLLRFIPRTRPTASQALAHKFFQEWYDEAEAAPDAPAVDTRVIDSYVTMREGPGCESGSSWLTHIAQQVFEFRTSGRRQLVAAELVAAARAACPTRPPPPRVVPATVGDALGAVYALASSGTAAAASLYAAFVAAHERFPAEPRFGNATTPPLQALQEFLAGGATPVASSVVPSAVVAPPALAMEAGAAAAAGGRDYTVAVGAGGSAAMESDGDLSHDGGDLME